MNRIIEVQGHRGCRGLMPENTLPAFMKALELGVTTLEMDLVVSGDNKVVVSHEPYFSHEISIAPDGKLISEENEMHHNIFKMTYDQISKYDVGLRPHQRFQKQKKMAVCKPLFSEVVQHLEKATYTKKLKKPRYNVEIKRRPQWDSIYHPAVHEFAQLVVVAIQQNKIKDRTTIQSFDIASLQKVRELDPEIKLVLLVENAKDCKENLNDLGFKPDYYSPEFELVTPALVSYCKSQNMQLTPWTVNSLENMKKMIDLDVDGIITDYPDILIILLNEMNIAVK